MNEQLEISIIENISRSYREAESLAQTAITTGREAVIKARECGQYLKEAKETVGHGKWLSWFEANSQAVANMSLRTAQGWMKLADIPEEALESMHSLKQAYLALGILPTTEREGGSQQAHADGQRWLSTVLKAWEAISASIEKKPMKEWRDTDRITLKEKLRPLVQLYETL